MYLTPSSVITLSVCVVCEMEEERPLNESQCVVSISRHGSNIPNTEQCYMTLGVHVVCKTEEERLLNNS
jgi:hypothetical protein